ncbi:hypothetical protein [Nonomuraea solani]|uniref:hypothetical protein n=1 Tax=Nonomuraea solani TaxID=1144553 RepID=UPI000CDEBEB1|nr:hypothetical protein [Nonomuraea solani]
MTDDRNRRRRQISIDGAGIERRKSAIQAIVDQAPARTSQQAETLRPMSAGPQDVKTPPA